MGSWNWATRRVPTRVARELWGSMGYLLFVPGRGLTNNRVESRTVCRGRTVRNTRVSGQSWWNLWRLVPCLVRKLARPVICPVTIRPSSRHRLSRSHIKQCNRGSRSVTCERPVVAQFMTLWRRLCVTRSTPGQARTWSSSPLGCCVITYLRTFCDCSRKAGVIQCHWCCMEPRRGAIT